MAHSVLKDCKLYIGGVDFSGDMNALALSHAAELADDTTFGPGTTRSRLGNLKGTPFEHSGFWEAVPDAATFPIVGIQGQIMTVAPTDGAEGQVAYFGKVIVGSYRLGGSVGDVLPFTISGEMSDLLVRGTVLANETASIVSGTGTAFQIGLIGAGQIGYAALHVLSASAGDTLDVKIESDDSGGFGTPTDRITFAQATTEGAEWKSLAGPIALDDFWRIDWTIGGVSPSFDFAVVFGII